MNSNNKVYLCKSCQAIPTLKRVYIPAYKQVVVAKCTSCNKRESVGIFNPR